MNPVLLASVAAHHEFHADGICRSLIFEADPETRFEIARRHLAARMLPGSFRLYATTDSILDGPVACRFTAHSLDPLFELHTECPATNASVVLHYSGDRLLEDGTTLEPRLEGAPASPPGRPIRLVVAFGIPPRTEEVPTQTTARIALRARRFRWKYHLTGEFAQRKVDIVDLGSSDAPLGFSLLPTPGPGGSASWISDHEIPAREIATQRLQLRDTETGRVLVKRLPNPDFRTFGREPLGTGGNALVVEAFIHP